MRLFLDKFLRGFEDVLGLHRLAIIVGVIHIITIAIVNVSADAVYVAAVSYVDLEFLVRILLFIDFFLHFWVQNHLLVLL